MCIYVICCCILIWCVLFFFAFALMKFHLNISDVSFPVLFVDISCGINFSDLVALLFSAGVSLGRTTWPCTWRGTSEGKKKKAWERGRSKRRKRRRRDRRREGWAVEPRTARLVHPVQKPVGGHNACRAAHPPEKAVKIERTHRRPIGDRDWRKTRSS